MSIATYAELSTAVTNWLHRSDLASVIPDFISLGESALNRELRLLSMENTASITTSTTTRFATLPTGFLEAIDLALYADDYPQVLTQIPLADMNFRSISADSTALPRFYAISTNLVFDTVSDEAYTLSLRYFKKLDLTTDLTNDVLTSFPDLYLHSALFYACTYIMDDAGAQRWASLLARGIGSANHNSAKNRNKARLVTDAGLRHRNSGDILTGVTL